MYRGEKIIIFPILYDFFKNKDISDQSPSAVLVHLRPIQCIKSYIKYMTGFFKFKF